MAGWVFLAYCGRACCAEPPRRCDGMMLCGKEWEGQDAGKVCDRVKVGQHEEAWLSQLYLVGRRQRLPNFRLSNNGYRLG